MRRSPVNAQPSRGLRGCCRAVTRACFVLPFVLSLGLPPIGLADGSWYVLSTAWGFRAFGIVIACTAGLAVEHYGKRAEFRSMISAYAWVKRVERRGLKPLVIGFFAATLLALVPDVIGLACALSGICGDGHSAPLGSLPGGFGMASISLFVGIAAGLASGMMLLESAGQCSTDTAPDPEAVRGMHGACVRDPDMAPARAPLLRLIIFGFWMNLFCAQLLAGETLGAGDLAGTCIVSLTSALVVVCRHTREGSGFLRQRLWERLGYCWGTITWYLLGRVLDVRPIVAPLPAGTIFAIWLVLLVVCTVPVFRQRVGHLARRGSRHADSAGPAPACVGGEATPGAIDGIDSEESMRDALVEMGLTEREAAVALAAMRGKTSRQIGDDLGIRPSTVRNHLSHAYRKCDVASTSELKRRVGAACAMEVPGRDRTTKETGDIASQGCGHGENGQSKAPADHRRTFLIRAFGCVRALYIAVMVAFAAVSFIPTGFEQAGWGYGRDILMGFSAVPCVAAALVLHLTSAGGMSMRVSRSHRVSLACSLVPAAASIMACCALPIDPWDLALLVHDPVEVLLIFVISGTYGAGAVLVVVAYARSARYGSTGHRGRLGMLVLFAIGAVALIYGASIDPAVGRMVLAGLMCFAALLEQLLLWRYGGQRFSGGGAAAACCESSHVDTRDAITLGLIMAVAAVVGCAYEETWRNSGPFSLMYVMLLLVIFACALLVLAAARQPAMLRPMLILIGVACCALFMGAPAMHTCLLVASILFGACLATACRMARLILPHLRCLWSGHRARWACLPETYSLTCGEMHPTLPSSVWVSLKLNRFVWEHPWPLDVRSPFSRSSCFMCHGERFRMRGSSFPRYILVKARSFAHGHI